MDDPVGDPLDQLVVGDDEAGRALGPDEVAQDAQDLLGGRAIELAGRLVGEQQRRPGGQGHRERDPLLLAARQLVAERAAAIRQADPLEQLVDASASLGRPARRAGPAAGRSPRRP